MDTIKKIQNPSPVRRSSVEEQAREFIRAQIKKEKFVMNTVDIPNKRVRDFLKKNDYLYSPCKSLFILKKHSDSKREVVERNYFQIVQNLTGNGIVSGKLALNHHLGKNEKIPDVTIYNDSKNNAIEFQGDNTYVVRYQKSDRFRKVDRVNMNGAKIFIETPESYLINNYVKESENDDFRTLMLNTNFMIPDIKEFIDNGASISSLSQMALDYKENENVRNFSVIKTAIEQSGHDFRYPSAEKKALLDDEFNIYDDPGEPEPMNPKIARFQKFITELDQQCDMYLDKQDLRHIERKPKDVLMNQIEDYIVHDSYHSLTIENYKLSMDDIMTLNNPEEEPEKTKEIESKLAIKGYLNSFQKVKLKIENDYGTDGEIKEKDVIDINNRLFQYYAKARNFDQPDTYRKKNVEITQTTHLPPDFQIVPEYMNEFYSYINNLDTTDIKDVIKKAVMTHYLFVYIHPFGDGNGRTARFLMNYTLGTQKLDWLTILSQEKDQYFHSLRFASENQNIIPFTEFVLDQFLKQTH